MGMPYAGSKLIDGAWYFRTVSGDGYRQFSFQHKVREVVQRQRPAEEKPEKL